MSAKPFHPFNFLSCVPCQSAFSHCVWAGGLVITSLVAVCLTGGQGRILHLEGPACSEIPTGVAVWADVPFNVPRQQWRIHRPVLSCSSGDWLLIISAVRSAHQSDTAVDEAELPGPWERTQVQVTRQIVSVSPDSGTAFDRAVSGEGGLRWQRVPSPVARNAARPAKTLTLLNSSADRSSEISHDREGTEGIHRKIRPFPSGYQPDDAAQGLIELRMVAEKRRCRVWVPLDETIDDAVVSFAERALTLLDEVCLSRVEADQGVWPDVDGDGILNVVISPAVAKAGAQVWAYVRPGDIWSEDPSLPPWDVLYLSPEAPLPQLPPILVHELTHLAQFSWSRHRNVGGLYSLPDWLTEGLAHAAELRAGVSWSNTTPRLTAFLQRPQECPLVVVDAAGSGYWRHPGQRGASAAFCDWHLRHSPGWSWDQLLIPFATSETPWKDVTARNFSELYRAWTIELATSGMPGADSQATLFPDIRDLKVGEEREVELHGTATSYCRLRPAPREGGSPSVQEGGRKLRDEIVIQSGGNRPLQVTLIQMP